LPKASSLLVLDRTKLYCIYTWRRELVISVVPLFKLSATFISTYSPAWSTAPAMAAPIQNLELGKGIPARGAVTKEVHDLTNIGGLFFSVFFSEIGLYIARSSVWGSSLLPGVARASSVLEMIIIILPGQPRMGGRRCSNFQSTLHLQLG
jgi:hypothetical protein